MRSLANYRPITLLNADIKLLMLIMSAQLQRPLDYLIDISQSAFLTGKDIAAQQLEAKREGLTW